jgi:hypothetical protein
MALGATHNCKGIAVSIVRVGLAETHKFAQGYDTIFGRKRNAAPPAATSAKRKRAVRKKPSKKK